MLLLVLSGCSQDTIDQMKRLGLPPPASDRSPYMSSLWIGGWIAAAVVGLLVWGLILWCVVRYRRKRDDEVPVQMRYHLPIEMLYTIAPIIVVAVFFFFTVQKQDKILEPVDHPDHHILVTAQQWSWTFSYLDEKAVGGKDVYDVGTPEHLPHLWLVKGESTKFTLHSPDVIHSFWVPSFYFKLDVIPGRDQSFSMTPTREGVFDGRCAELCGWGHSTMLFKVHIVDRAAFDRHMHKLEAKGQIGAPRGGEDSEVPDGLETANEGGTR
ncbi:MAG: aa3-type cytochrome oxidase subunit II [Nocardioidaceae bacterium]